MPEAPVVERIANVTAFVGDTFEPRVVDLEIRDGRIASIDRATGELISANNFAVVVRQRLAQLRRSLAAPQGKGCRGLSAHFKNRVA